MASNINVRRDGDVPQTQMQQGQQPGRSEWEPARIMRALLSWDPFRELNPSYGQGYLGNDQQLMTAFDVKDTPEAFVFHADVPGVQEKDIEVQLHGNRLMIRGKRDEEKKPSHTFYTYERSYGSFARSFTLPDSADTENCKADLKDGVLTVTVPKKAKEQPRTVAVNKSSQPMKS